MIDAAAQILQSANTEKTSADKSSASRRNSHDFGSSFSQVYDRSKSDNVKKPEEPISKRSQSKPSESAVPDKPSAQSSAKAPERKQEVSKNESSGKDDDSNVNKNETESASNTQAKAQTEAQEQEGTSSEKSAESDVPPVQDEEEVSIADLTLKNEDDQLNGLNIGRELKLFIDENELPHQKLGELAQSIVNEFKASVDKSDKLGKNEEPVALSRSQVLAEIEKVLDVDKLNEQNIPAQLLKPEMTVNVNAAKVLSEQIKAKDLNITLEPGAEPEEILEVGVDEIVETADPKALLEKIMERLDFSKLKAESDHFSKIIADKTTISDFVDQLTEKVGNESADRPMFAQAVSLAGKPGMVAPAQQLTMTTRMDQPEWGSEFSKRINFMVGNDIKHAELRLDPPELGRINIKISMSQDQATVSFSSAHGNVREAIENTLPRLRELLNDSGIQLADANINDRKEQNSNQAEGDSNLSGPAFPEADEEADSSDASQQVTRFSADGVIDYFA